MFCCLDRSIAFASAVVSFIAMADLICLERQEKDVLAASGSEVDPATAFPGIMEIKLTLERCFERRIAAYLALERHSKGV